MHCESWCSLSDEELGQRDIAEVNLAAAFGLPYADSLDISALRYKLDGWTDIVRRVTDRALLRRTRELCLQKYSEAQLRILAMVTVLQRDLGIRYNLAFMEGEYDASDSHNLFIHGPLTGRGFTCVTAPVIYAAIGRRLGYPIKLVHAKEHTFCRWDEQDGERFNIEATSPGLTMPPDEVYCKWPKPITPEEVKRDRYLCSLSPREELAFFISQRGCCCMDNLETFHAMEAFYYAHKLIPDLPVYGKYWAVSTIMHRLAHGTNLPVGTQAHVSQEKPTPSLRILPLPGKKWEKPFLPLALEHLNRINRIGRNRRAKCDASAHNKVFQQMAMN
jgi:hypothetical protein